MVRHQSVNAATAVLGLAVILQGATPHAVRATDPSFHHPARKRPQPSSPTTQHHPHSTHPHHDASFQTKSHTPRHHARTVHTQQPTASTRRSHRLHPHGIPITNCSVVIAGGSTSALAAAVASAREGVRTCLFEPTDWVGGQMTSAGDPAIDFNQAPVISDGSGVSVDPAGASHYPGNHGPDFNALMDSISTTGRCSVSTKCFLPKEMVFGGMANLLATPAVAQHLEIYYHSVPVAAIPAPNNPNVVDTVQFVQRFPRVDASCNGWDAPLSAVVEDWYDPTPSARFDKRVLNVGGVGGGGGSVRASDSRPPSSTSARSSASTASATKTPPPPPPPLSSIRPTSSQPARA
eukprot:m.89774 g.89774  ORF g.89774 m.89774 type:complete len:349 (-) comp9821_c0_seq1:96-1142(-)